MKRKLKILTKILNKPYVLIGVLMVAFLLTRLPGLYADNINPDGSNWHWRSEQFMNGIKYAQFEKTYQHYQPGVTLMWIIGLTVETLKQIFPNSNTYNPITFPLFHYFSKLTLIFVQLTLTVVSVYALEKLVGIKKAVLTGLIFTLEPFFLGNSRVLHMDVLLSLLLFNGLLFSYWSMMAFDEEENLSLAPILGMFAGMFAGLFLGLAFLTKSVGIGGFLYAAGVGGLYLLTKRGVKYAVKYSLSVIVVSLATIFVFFPALWVDGRGVIEKILSGITGNGFGGHGEIFFGKYTRNPGWLFYPVVVLIKSTPFLIAGCLAFLMSKVKLVNKLYKSGEGERYENSKEGKKDENNNEDEKYQREFLKKFEMTPELFLGIFYLGYVVVISIVTKKIDRYVLPVYLYLAFLAAGGFIYLSEKSKGLVFSVFMFFVFVVFPLFSFYPYYFTYVSPLFGSPKFVHKNILAQKPFGIGMFELKDYILDNYGLDCKEGLDFLPDDSTVCRRVYPRVAKWDVKPLKYVYDTDQLRITSYEAPSSFDVLVVAVDEEIPERVLADKRRFVHEHSIYINGLEYWKIYLRARPDANY